MANQEDSKTRWVVEENMTAAQLTEYVGEIGVSQDQLILVNEPVAGQFTLIYVGSQEQIERVAAWEAENLAAANQMLDEIRAGQAQVATMSTEQLKEFIERANDALEDSED